MPLLRVYKKKTKKVTEYAGPCLPKQWIYERRNTWLTHHFRSGDQLPDQKSQLEEYPLFTTEDCASKTPGGSSPAAANTVSASPAGSTPLQDERSPTESASDLPSTPVTLSDVPEKADHDKPVTDPALLLPALHWQPMRPASAMPSFTPAWADEDTRPLFKRPAVPECTSTITAQPACKTSWTWLSRPEAFQHIPNSSRWPYSITFKKKQFFFFDYTKWHMQIIFGSEQALIPSGKKNTKWGTVQIVDRPAWLASLVLYIYM